MLPFGVENQKSTKIEAFRSISTNIEDRGLKVMDGEIYDVQDVIDAEYTLEPLACRLCGSLEVVFLQYVGDAVCQECGEWQLDNIKEVGE